MRFKYDLYPYQEEVLKIFESERKKGEKKIHIVAPPGSGKTVVGCEMLSRGGTPSLILVPNITLQQQWKDKLETLFFEEHESTESLISTRIDEIKYINILTYQSLAGTTDDSDDIENEILDLWYESEKIEFPSREIFLDFLQELRDTSPEEYKESYASYRKRLKNTGESSITRKMMRDKILDYTKHLKEYGVGVMIVDEAHHLTSWWSHVLFEIWKDLSEPYIIGLTATPPFDDVDYFELDMSYTRLLGEVDYFVPTPAIVRSGRLAPYSDLIYIVSPDTSLSETLKQKEILLHDFLEIHQGAISLFLHTFLSENYEKLKVKSGDLCDKWMRFVYRYKSEDIDMGSYIHGGISDTISLEDIAKSVGKWAYDDYKKKRSAKLLDEVKSLFFDLGYIWRGASLYRFETPLEKGLVYSKSKIAGALEILKKEKENLGADLRCALITDFLDADSDWINCHSIFDSIAGAYPELDPYIVSGQGIWRLENGTKTPVDGETILSITQKFSAGEIQILIGTRGILGEGWDCPKLNVLIDLTGVSAYMSVNQVHGRAIRLDRENSEKVANIYDIVCLGEGYQGLRDFERLRKKHTQFYGVDDAGLVIKGLDHIYPHLEKNIRNIERINTYTLKKSALRSMVKELWNIGGDFKNEEIFSLSLEINNPFEVYPIPTNIGFFKIIRFDVKESEKINMLELGKTQYHSYVRRWIRQVIEASLQVLKSQDILPYDFSYELTSGESGTITVISRYKDAFIAKKFIEIIYELFTPITNQKYKYVQIFHKKKILDEMPGNFGIYFLTGLLLGLPAGGLAIIGLLSSEIVLGIFISSGIMGGSLLQNKLKNVIQSIPDSPLFLGLPEIISSNEEKRRIFLGKKLPDSWYWNFKRIITLDGKIIPVEKSDIGKPPFLSAKIEKLWI